MIIYKYCLELTDTQVLKLPLIIKPLSVGVHDGKIFIWLAVEVTEKQQEVEFLVVPTGVEIKFLDDYTFIGTVNTGSLWWHIFMGDVY